MLPGSNHKRADIPWAPPDGVLKLGRRNHWKMGGGGFPLP